MERKVLQVCRSVVCCCYLFDHGVDGGVHGLGYVQRLGHHVGGALGDLVLIVDHQGTAIGHHDRIRAWKM